MTIFLAVKSQRSNRNIASTPSGVLGGRCLLSTLLYHTRRHHLWFLSRFWCFVLILRIGGLMVQPLLTLNEFNLRWLISDNQLPLRKWKKLQKGASRMKIKLLRPKERRLQVRALFPVTEAGYPAFYCKKFVFYHC